MSGTFTLTVECRLAASHILPGCPPCDRLHGHTWTVRVAWAFTGLDELGMGMNFRTLKDALEAHVRARFDHQHLNDLPPFQDRPPTAENLAREVYLTLEKEFDPGPQGRLRRVEVWEGPSACATYEE